MVEAIKYYCSNIFTYNTRHVYNSNTICRITLHICQQNGKINFIQRNNGIHPHQIQSINLQKGSIKQTFSLDIYYFLSFFFSLSVRIQCYEFTTNTYSSIISYRLQCITNTLLSKFHLRKTQTGRNGRYAAAIQKHERSSKTSVFQLFNQILSALGYSPTYPIVVHICL